MNSQLLIDGGDKKKIIYLLFSILILYSCQSNFPEASTIAYKGTDNLGNNKLVTNDCEIIPYYTIQYNFNNFPLKDAVDESFNNIWTQSFPRLIFQAVDLSSKAKIRIEVSDPNNTNFGNSLIYSNTTIANNKLPPTTKLERTVDGNFIITVNNKIFWSKVSLIRALSFQIGRVLGLQISNLEEDIMYPKMYTPKIDSTIVKLSKSDVKVVTNLYPKLCDNSNKWTIRKSELSPFFNETNKYSQPVTFALPNNDTLYLLCPDKTLKKHRFYKVLFNKLNPQKDIWKQGQPLTIENISSETIQPVGIYTFTIGNRAFVGSSQWFTNPKKFFEYNPNSGSFTSIPISLKTNREVYSIGIGGPNNKGYVLNVNQDDATKSSISIFNPTNTSENWSNISVPEPFYTATTMFSTQDNRVCFYNGFAAYFLNSENEWSKLSFNTADPNKFIEPRNLIVGANELSLKAFNIGNRTFLIRDNYGVERNRLGAGVDNEVLSDDFWEIELPNFQFKNLASVPAQGIILAVFGHKGFGYIITSKGYIYSYSL